MSHNAELVVAPRTEANQFRAYVIDPHAPVGLRVYCECPGTDDVAYWRAEFIRRAVNSHERLLDACRAVLPYFEGEHDQNHPHVKQLRSAIAAAEVTK